MPQQAPAGLLVINGDLRLLRPAADGLRHPGKALRLQSAAGKWDQLVAAAAVKPKDHLRPLPSHGEHGLVAIAVRQGRGNDLRQLRGKAADAPQGVFHPPGLQPELFFIGDMAKIAAAAPGKHRAVRRDPAGRRIQQPQDPAEGIGPAHLQQLHLRPVAPGAARHKHRQALRRPSHAIALGGIILQRQDAAVIFLQAHAKNHALFKISRCSAAFR